MKLTLTRKQQEVFDFLVQNQDIFRHPPTLEELCASLGCEFPWLLTCPHQSLD